MSEFRRWYRRTKLRMRDCLYCLPDANPLSITPQPGRVNHYVAYQLAPMRRAYYRKSRGHR
jgi:hypothetical protein